MSIAWGGFSLLLIYLLHPPVEDLVFWLPGAVTEKVCLCLAVLFAADTALSVQKALDLKALLTSLSATSQRLQALEEKLKSAAGQLGMELEGGRLSLSSEPGHRARESRRAYLLRRLEERRDRTSRLWTAWIGRARPFWPRWTSAWPPLRRTGSASAWRTCVPS
mgnify:CR=1 FL=1